MRRSTKWRQSAGRMAGLFLGLSLTLLLPACGRVLRVTVVDERSGTPMPDAQVGHVRGEWRMLGILPVYQPIMQQHGTTDANGNLLFKDVRDGDILSVSGGGSADTWFGPVRPVTKMKSGPNTKVAEQYQRMNADSPPDRITLPVPRER